MKGGLRSGWRGALAGVTALVVAGMASVHAAGMVFQLRAPSLALQLDEDNPVALVRDAQMRIAAGGTAEAGQGDAVLAAARRSVAQLPLNADAFQLYGLIQLANADPSAMSRQVAMADRLSRRDLGSQLFLIEDAVRRNDVAAALRHYDTAMRVQESSRAILFPILTEALSEPAIRQRFLPYMTSSNPWLEPFLRFAIGNASEPESIAALAIEAGGFPEGDRFATRDRELLAVLIGNGDYGMALRLFRSVANVDSGVLTQAGFTEAATDPAVAPFTWQPITVAGIDPIFLAGNGDTLDLEARLDSGYDGWVVRKLFTLAPGAYTFQSALGSRGAQPNDTARWQIRCVDGGGEAELLVASTRLGEESTVGGRFTVPADCTMQQVLLSATTQVSAQDVTLTVSSPRLIRD